MYVHTLLFSLYDIIPVCMLSTHYVNYYGIDDCSLVTLSVSHSCFFTRTNERESVLHSREAFTNFAYDVDQVISVYVSEVYVDQTLIPPQ